MKAISLYSLVLPILFCCLTPLPSIAYQKGVALGLYSKDPRYSYRDDLKEIRETGADHVSLVVSWYQKNIHSDEIYPLWEGRGDFDTIADRKVEEVIRQAHELGLRVFLFPILRIEERRQKEWRGTLSPQHPSLWLESYRRFTLHYAGMAAREEVEIFSIGSELCSMEKQDGYWKRLIAEVRKFYPGKILYSANWDHYRKIGFWDQLDFIGLNGYYELASNTFPDLKTLLKKWWEIGNEISAWQEARRKKIVFTEIGYPSLDGACGKPWDYTREAEVDLEEQALCYEAFFLSWAENKNLAGVYFWNWYGQGGPNDRSYTPRGKPAEEVLTRWYSNSLALSSPYSPLRAPAPNRPAVRRRAPSPTSHLFSPVTSRAGGG